MSDLKDRFAMAAMVAILRRENRPLDYLDVARDAYRCAEFMVRERQEQIDLIALKEKQNNSDMQTLHLRPRLHYALLLENLHTIADVCAYTEKEILRIPNIGRTQLAHLITALAEVGERLTAPREK